MPSAHDWTETRNITESKTNKQVYHRVFAAGVHICRWLDFHPYDRYKINIKMEELKEQWRVEKAALELAEAQMDIKEVSLRKQRTR